jgi:hypothetical protein
MAERETSPWMLRYKKTKKGAPRIDWDESILPPVPFGMECKSPTAPIRKQPKSSVWDELEAMFS